MHRIRESIQQQLQVNQAKNMLYGRLDRIMEIDPEFLAALEELVAHDDAPLGPEALQEAVSFASKALLKRIHAVNQFVRADRKQLARLESIYLRTWKRIVKTRDIQATLMDYHYPALSRWLADLYPEQFRAPLRARPTVGRVVCEEYSPQLQIDLLRLAPLTLKQPILDVGCGSKAALVRYLRSLGLEASGIDRDIEQAEPYLQPTDWFDLPFVPNSWGTIVSNMSFSNHLSYARRYDPVLAKSYLAKFDEILTSLVPGGTFAFAPGITGIERRLPAAYRVKQIPFVKGINCTRITRLAA